MQQNLQITTQLTKQIWEVVKKGDIKLLKAEQEKLGLSIAHFKEESLKQNAIFQATNIKDHQLASDMVAYLVS